MARPVVDKAPHALCHCYEAKPAWVLLAETVEDQDCAKCWGPPFFPASTLRALLMLCLHNARRAGMSPVFDLQAVQISGRREGALSEQMLLLYG